MTKDDSTTTLAGGFSFADGFAAVKQLDNTNVFGVLFSLAMSNIFKEGMWMKVLSPYTLLVASLGQVGLMLTVHGISRAVVSVLSGVSITWFGADTVLVVAGYVGIIGLMTNIGCLLVGGMEAIYVVTFVWGVYDGLWNSCLEIVWAKSIPEETREAVNWARQVIHKGTQMLGPLLSLIIFHFAGNRWELHIVRNVMFLGTAFTSLPVLICFLFHRMYEVRQEVKLCEVKALQFSSVEIPIRTLKKSDLLKRPEGLIRLSYPLSNKSKYGRGRLRILTPDLQDSQLILGKQFAAVFKDVCEMEEICTVHFEDPSRDATRVAIESISVFLRQDQSVNTQVSSLVFNLYPDLTSQNPTEGPLLMRGARKLLHLEANRLEASSGDPAVQVSEANQHAVSGSHVVPRMNLTSSAAKNYAAYTPNVYAANVILVCDVLSAVGIGLSLCFMDLFLIQVYELTPQQVMLVAFVESFTSMWLTPVARLLMQKVRECGYHAKTGVVLLWCMSLVFLGALCFPQRVPLTVVLPAVCLWHSLNSVTTAYNRGKLVSYLPHDRVAHYMVWDSLNKASQGGITVLGAMVVQRGGYHMCFLCTFVIMSVRCGIYGFYAARRVGRSWEKHRLLEMPAFVGLNDHCDYDHPLLDPEEPGVLEDRATKLGDPSNSPERTKSGRLSVNSMEGVDIQEAQEVEDSWPESPRQSSLPTKKNVSFKPRLEE